MFPTEDSVYREMFDEVSSIARESVTPIGVLTPGEIRQHGTGTFFAVGDAHFLVSAAHVFNQARDAGAPLCCFANGEQTNEGQVLTPVPLSGKVLTQETPIDVGVYCLSEETVSQLSGRRFLRLNDVLLSPVTPGWGWVVGFPGAMVHRHSNSLEAYNPLNWGSVISAEEPSGVENYDSRFHFVLEHDPRTAGRLDDGPAFELPETFRGISGCAVWQTWWPGQDYGNDWKTRRVRVVGVQTSCYRKHTIRATTWRAAAILMAASEPELHEVFRMHFPGWDVRDQARRLGTPRLG